jgi:hypothetical protein
MTPTLKSANDNLLNPCREQLDRFFAAHPNAGLKTRALKTLRLMAAGEKALTGKPEGWAAGVIYAVANLDRQACGVPGLLNSEFAKFFGVRMETARRRAAQIMRQVTI